MQPSVDRYCNYEFMLSKSILQMINFNKWIHRAITTRTFFYLKRVNVFLKSMCLTSKGLPTKWENTAFPKPLE